MSKVFNQFQNDVSGTASAIVTQMICAERGINYADVQAMAQQAHVNGILQAEQQRQMNQVINRHYQGGSLIAKVRDVFGAQPSNFLVPQPQGMGMPMAQPVLQQPVANINPYGMQTGYAPQQVAQHISQPQFQQAPPAPQFNQAPQQTSALPDMEMLTSLISQVVSQLAPQQAAPQPVNPNPYPQQPAQGMPPFDSTVAGTQDI